MKYWIEEQIETMPAVREKRDRLVELYVNQKKTQEEIGAIFGVHQMTISKWLERYGIKARGVGVPPQVILPEEELRRLYLEEKWTLRQLVAHFKCGTGTVQRNLRDYGFQMSGEQKRKVLIERNKRRYSQQFEKRGYLHIRKPDHPYASQSGYVGEHRLVVEAFIGRYLEPHEHVHHIDLRKRNNVIENLAVLPCSGHVKVHGYMERAGAYLCGLSPIRPEALDFGAPVFWGGKYVTSIDLIQGRHPLQRPLGEEAKEATSATVN